MKNEQPTNLKEAVEFQLEKMEIHPTRDVTSKYQTETNLSPGRVSEATLEALRELGIKKVPPGDLLISSYLENKKVPDTTLDGKEL